MDWPLLAHVLSLAVDTAAGRLRAERLVEDDAGEVATVLTGVPDR